MSTNITRERSKSVFEPAATYTPIQLPNYPVIPRSEKIDDFKEFLNNKKDI